MLEVFSNLLCVLNTILSVLNTILCVLNTILRVLNTILRVLNTILDVLNTIFDGLDTILSVLNTILCVLNMILRVLNTILRVLNTILGVLNTILCVLNMILRVLNTILDVLNPISGSGRHLLLQGSAFSQTGRKIYTTISAYQCQRIGFSHRLALNADPVLLSRLKNSCIVCFAGVGIYFSLDSKTLAHGMLNACFALNLRHKRSKCLPRLLLLCRVDTKSAYSKVYASFSESREK